MGCTSIRISSTARSRRRASRSSFPRPSRRHLVAALIDQARPWRRLARLDVHLRLRRMTSFNVVDLLRQLGPQYVVPFIHHLHPSSFDRKPSLPFFPCNLPRHPRKISRVTRLQTATGSTARIGFFFFPSLSSCLHVPSATGFAFSMTLPRLYDYHAFIACASGCLHSHIYD